MHILDPHGSVSLPAPSAADTLITAVSGTDHLVLMRPILDDCFGRDDKRSCATSAQHVHIGADGAQWKNITFDTVMNAVPAEFYHRVAGLHAITLVVRAKASAWRVRILRRLGDAQPEIVAEAHAKAKGEIVLEAPLRQRPERLFLELSYQGEIDLGEVAWTTPAPKTLRPLGVSITTYNKPDYLRPNLELLSRSAAFKAGKLDVLVVNNGAPLEDMPKGIEIQQMPNIGGTGGFLTGFEHFKAKGYAHFVIMDDDIAIPQDFIDRLYAISCLAQGYHVGTMAEILNTGPRVVKEQGGNVAGGDLFGLQLLHPMTDLASPNRQSLYGFFEVDFSGWWSLLVDLSTPTPTIPEKQFIKRDDIMFGYESRKAGVPTIVFPNLIVAHGEEGAPTYYYYDIRNDLILRARNHPGLGISLKQLFRIAGMLALTLRGDQQRMFNQALRDFMAGPKALAKSDLGGKLKEIRGLAQKAEPLPEHAPHLHGGDRPGLRALVRGFLSPKAWRGGGEVPVVHSNPLRHAMGRARYIEPVLYTNTGYLRERRLSLVTGFLTSLWLVMRLYLRRKPLYAAYKREA